MVYLSLKSYELALDDAETACKLQPYWLNGHLRKAQALTNLGKTEDALKEFLFCLVLDSENKTAKSEAQKLLLNILSPGHRQGDFPDVLQMMSHPSRLKGSLISSDPGINNLGSYQPNVEYKKNLILPEQTISTGYNSVWKSLQTLENIKEGHSKDTLSSEECLKTSLTCNPLKRKLCKNDTSEVTSPELPSKLPKTDVSVDESADVDLPVFSPVDSSDLECSLCMRYHVISLG
ncbi:unnamed protein product [Staurois parvus]|uniref:LON peptidase N-terminal domain and RING finger protein 2 n=1 Tax=Staurois parvus TaxID=386267 RepID=A0ABN9FH60_9NEOB|nr:unnamed protein product [Staurois parvus]